MEFASSPGARILAESEPKQFESRGDTMESPRIEKSFPEIGIRQVFPTMFEKRRSRPLSKAVQGIEPK
ncbi:hypothetical protein ACJ73_07717 [Blastomyces percursus]|uniref:Uncharacterized protein n=1 Tax=Blastomyces percursus TaxID=1658174 RepID=A0A1J9PX70_9EURO|nr:hypothetical protein ACJ73_07717 [Blastomyces percursus]